MGVAIAHNLAGAEGNVDYRGQGKSAGKQAIYNSSGNLVLSSENMGTYDFGTPGTKAHKVMDVNPWVRWGNAPQDSTTSGERNATVEWLMNMSDWLDYYNIAY